MFEVMAQAFDLPEPNRPVVDRVLLKSVDEETFSGADFDLQSGGVGPQLDRDVNSST